MNFIERLVYWRENKILRPFVNTFLMYFFHIEIPREVKIGKGLRLVHRGDGLVISKYTKIGLHLM